MSTAKQILAGCDRAMLAEVAGGHAQPEVREAFRRQLLAGCDGRLLAAGIERQTDWTATEPPGQQIELF